LKKCCRIFKSFFSLVILSKGPILEEISVYLALYGDGDRNEMVHQKLQKIGINSKNSYGLIFVVLKEHCLNKWIFTQSCVKSMKSEIKYGTFGQWNDATTFFFYSCLFVFHIVCKAMKWAWFLIKLCRFVN
jgi:hypothetical protein